MMIKSPLPESVALLEKVHECLGPNRLPLLIAIDGADGVGKSSLASWLAHDRPSRGQACSTVSMGR
jgi:pantothenate kinase-related protein Tda10